MLEEESGRAQGLGEETGFSSPLYLFGRSVIFLLRPDRDIGRLSARMDLVMRLRMYPIPSIGGYPSSECKVVNRTRTGQVPNVMCSRSLRSHSKSISAVPATSTLYRPLRYSSAKEMYY